MSVELLKAHVPSLTIKNEDEIADLLARFVLDTVALEPTKVDFADLAIRTCGCGVRIDGFYQYVDHIQSVLFPGSDPITGE